MLVANTYEEAPWDPNNPGQVNHFFYGYPYGNPQAPNGWQAVHYNKIAPAGSLAGLGRALGSWAALPGWGQLAIVGGIAAVVGYFGMAKYGDKYVKPALAKVGLRGLRGLGRARRRRR